MTRKYLTNKRKNIKILVVINLKEQKMIIRPATVADAKAANEIYDSARGFMRETGNLGQWTLAYPGLDDILSGIEDGTSYVCVEGEEIVGTFYFRVGEDPTYIVIYDGEWKNADTYAAVHRVAVKYHGRGIGKFIYDECFKMHPNLKIDTHRDNIPMQHSLEKCDFEYCGIIHLANGDERMAYQRTK